MGRPEELFRRIRERGPPEVHSMVNRRYVEEPFLEYKRAYTPASMNTLDARDRESLAIAISGFANSDGGVIVWGVACRHTRSGDVPTRLFRIADPLLLKYLFDEIAGGLTIPYHRGVETIYLIDRPRSDGFVLTFIPSGLHVPYRVTLTRQDYYIRVGGSFISAPHDVLAGLFGRPPRSNVITTVALSTIDVTGENIVRINLQVSMRNEGRAIAEDIYSVVDVDVGGRIAVEFSLSKKEYLGWRKISRKRNYLTLMYGELRLPPGTERSVFEACLEINSSDAGHAILSFTTGSRHAPGNAFQMEFSAELVRQIYHHFTRKHFDDAAKQAETTKLESAIKARLQLPRE
jgi:hypothetical protein